MTVDIEKGIDLWMRIAAPRALLENEEWWRWPTQPPRSLAWSNGLRCVSCKKAILVLRDLRLLITLLHLTGEFRPLTFQLVNRTVPLGADKENLLATNGMGMTVWAEKELTSPSSTNNRHQRLRLFCIGLNMFSLAYVQALYKLVSLQNRLDPCLHAVGEGDTELGWIQESRFVSTLVKLRHEAFVLCSFFLTKACTYKRTQFNAIHITTWSTHTHTHTMPTIREHKLDGQNASSRVYTDANMQTHPW